MNTDNVAVSTAQPAGPTTCLSSQSPFVAAKAANIPPVIERHGIDAPHGLFVMIPQQHLLFYAPAELPNTSRQLDSLVDFVQFPTHRRPGQQPAPRRQPRHLLLLARGRAQNRHARRHPQAQELMSNPRIGSANLAPRCSLAIRATVEFSYAPPGTHRTHPILPPAPPG